MGLDAVEFILWCEKEFGIEIPDAEASEMTTVGDLSIFIHRQLFAKDGFKAMSEAQVFECMKEYLVKNFRIPLAAVVRSATFIKDLGLD